MKLVTDRSRNISRLKALLDRLGINSNGDFTTYKRLKAISTKNTTTIYNKLVKNYIERISELTQKLNGMEKDISSVTCNEQHMVNLINQLIEESSCRNTVFTLDYYLYR